MTDDYTQVREVQAALKTASWMSEQMVQACRDDNPIAGGAIANLLYTSHDLNLTMLLLGDLAGKVVKAQDAARGPVFDPNATAADEPELWQIAQSDQAAGAYAAGNYEEYAEIVLDGLLQSFGADRDDPRIVVDLDHVAKCLAMIPQQALILVAAKALLRMSQL